MNEWLNKQWYRHHEILPLNMKKETINTATQLNQDQIVGKQN